MHPGVVKSGDGGVFVIVPGPAQLTAFFPHPRKGMNVSSRGCNLRIFAKRKLIDPEGVGQSGEIVRRLRGEGRVPARVPRVSHGATHVAPFQGTSAPPT